ncbi:MAG: phage tail tube protein [Candidatus Devosia phytovorans]|uniref:Phage tail tube protein n=1 Tax=Candidatus Devosia phytovorans TaxID=3121372 RepID=A0AAJ5VXL3_9HYPH|nr:phage tail tube protein [Devosia sp.]WEK05775.1 MAG: phage tail tube protein [Devosia sp.]
MATTKKLLIQFGDGADPEVFTYNCTINTSQDFTIEGTTVDATEPNCEEPDAPAWVLRSIDTLSAGINGAGTMDPMSFARLRDNMLSGEPFNVRVLIDLASAAGGGHFAGRYVATSLGIAKEGKGYVSATVALASDGAITWVPAT